MRPDPIDTVAELYRLWLERQHLSVGFVVERADLETTKTDMEGSQ